MARPRIPAGEIGTIQVQRLTSGRYRARASTRGDSGDRLRLTATADTADAARLDIRRQAASVSSGGVGTLSRSSTIAEAVELWLAQILARAKAGSLAYSTYEAYEIAARLVILPRCGGVRLDHLTVGRCDRILQRILEEETVSRARRARAVLSMVCGFAVRDDALDHNPVRDVQRLPTAPKKESVLTPGQINGVRELMRGWRRKPVDGVRPNYRALIDGMDIMLGTSMRIGECLGLRRCDVDITSSPPTVAVNGTIVSNKTQGTHRKDTPKRARQRRTITLPTTTAAAVRHRLALAELGVLPRDVG